MRCVTVSGRTFSSPLWAPLFYRVFYTAFFHTVFFCLVFFMLASANAQPLTGRGSDDITVQLGFGGEIVANAWNPLRVTMRDQDPAELVLELDAGNLRQGSSALRYTAALTGGPGFYTFEDDVYLPAWRTFSWRVRTAEAVLASGSVERRRVDAKPLELVLARAMSEGNRYFDRAHRVVDVLPEELPQRAAAYDGVSSLLILPSPSPASVGSTVAAATAGVTVVLAGSLGAAHREVLALATQPEQRFGAGWLVRVPSTERSSVRQALARTGLDPDTLLPALLSPELTRTPPNPSIVLVLAVLGGYALLATLLLRFGGAPGLVASLLLALVLSLGAERLRPDSLLLTRSRTLSLGAGDLALETDLQTLFSYPSQVARLSYPLHPADTGALRRWEVSPERFSLELPRYQAVVLFGKPRLNTASFTRRGADLVNLSSLSLSAVFDMETGRQNGVSAGGTVAQTSGNLIPPDLYAKLVPLLPPGSALSRQDGTLYIALPQPDGSTQP